ncbi:DoxX family protein [Mesonia sp.]|uniref:DoxX family protein n=2 Tax=Mesonia sp. TaxID=1960830 RepID=UPI003F95A998
MKNKIFMIIRIAFGIFLLFFGFDHFFNYIPFPEMTTEANAYFANLSSTGAMQFVGIVEIVSALAFIFNKYGALMAVILMSVSINAVLFHMALDPQKIYGALVLLLLNISMLYFYKNQYNQLLKT